ncbi:hypothetical protein HFP72_02680 [Nocardiopsis sp. ARC36]
MLFALSEPLRLEMVRTLAREGEVDSIDLGPDLPRSTLTHQPASCASPESPSCGPRGASA